MEFFTDTTYTSRFISNADSIIAITLDKVTAKTVTFTERGETKRTKIHHNDEGVAYFFPYGRYSMAPVLKADRFVLPLIEVTELVA